MYGKLANIKANLFSGAAKIQNNQKQRVNPIVIKIIKREGICNVYLLLIKHVERTSSTISVRLERDTHEHNIKSKLAHITVVSLNY